FDLRRIARGEPQLIIDPPPGRVTVADYMRNETRFRMVEKINPERFRGLAAAEDLAESGARRFATWFRKSRWPLQRQRLASGSTAHDRPGRAPGQAIGGGGHERASWTALVPGATMRIGRPTLERFCFWWSMPSARQTVARNSGTVTGRSVIVAPSSLVAP